MIESKYDSLTSRTLLLKATRKTKIAISTGPDNQRMEIKQSYQLSGWLKELAAVPHQLVEGAREVLAEGGVHPEVEVKDLKLLSRTQALVLSLREAPCPTRGKSSSGRTRSFATSAGNGANTGPMSVNSLWPSYRNLCPWMRIRGWPGCPLIPSLNKKLGFVEHRLHMFCSDRPQVNMINYMWFFYRPYPFEVRMKWTRICCLIDTGASISCLSRESYEAIPG